MKQLSQQQLIAMLMQGRKALQLGAFSQAEKLFLSILKSHPDIVEAKASLAYTYTLTKQHAKAIEHLRALLILMPNHAQTHLNLANSLFEQKHYLETITHYETAVNLDPKLVDAHINLGFTYRMMKNYDVAIACLHRALDLDKTNAKAFHVLGVIYVDIQDINRALHCLECANELSPEQAEYRVSFANVLEKANLDFEAGLQYHKACELNPNYLDSFILYGDYLIKMYRHDEALECITRAIYLAPKNLDLLDKLSQIYLAMNDTDAATAQYKATLEKEPQRIPSLLGLCLVQQELGNSAKAIELCDEIVAIDINIPDGYLLKSRMKKSKSDDGLAEQLLNFTTKDSVEINDETKCHVHFALGKIYDDQNNYAKAFNHYSIGNFLKNKTLNYNIESDKNKFSKLIEVFDNQLFNDFKHLGVESNLPIVIVGMPRSGTTLTEQIISSHPNVIGAGEVFFWGKAPTAMPLRLSTETPYPECVREINSEQAKDIASMYESSLKMIVGSDTNPKHITDKMPHNFLRLGLIALLFPNVKIIHTKRNPIDTCLSIFFQNFNTVHDYAADLGNLGFHYKQYERIMQHWHKVLPGRILDINYEDTIADPEFWSRKLIDHIGLEWDDACLAPHKLERTVKTASHWQVRQPIYKTSVQRWKNYEEFLLPLIEALK
jgi:tetratricopeptide (TPR) repeat protein